MAAGHEWRTLANRPGFPQVPFFHPQPAAAHFPPHILHLEQNRSVLGLSNRKLLATSKINFACCIHRNVLLSFNTCIDSYLVYLGYTFLPFISLFYCLPGVTPPQTQLNNQSTASNNNNNNPHSTTSPNSSPANVSLTNSSQLTPPPHTDENDNTMNDDAFENDNISVTGSPAHANSTEDDERRSPSPFQSSSSTIPPPPSQATAQSDTLGNGGAFTSLIQRNTKKSDFLSNFHTHLHQRPTAVSAAAVAAAAATAHPLHPQLPQQNHHSALNHALAAQLFLQSPLMPQPSQWLYSQLYGANYNELPWLRSTLQSTNGNRLMAGCANNTSAETILAQSNHPLCTDVDAFERGGSGGGGGGDSGSTGGGGGGGANRRCVTLISHLDDEKETSASPPVTSTKRTPSPHDDIEIVCNTSPVKPSKGDSSLKCRTPKHVDVWRPY